MTVKLFGAHSGSNRFKGNQGIGVEHLRADAGWVGGVGKAGDVEVVSVGDFHSGAVQQGYAFQAIGGSVKIAFSCINPTRATEANISTAPVWGNEITLTAPAITFVGDLGFTLIRITFVGTAELYIVTR